VYIEELGIVKKKNSSYHRRSLNASINSEQTQIAESTLMLSRAGVFISLELIKTAKMCRLHRDIQFRPVQTLDSWR